VREVEKLQELRSSGVQEFRRGIQKPEFRSPKILLATDTGTDPVSAIDGH